MTLLNLFLLLIFLLHHSLLFIETAGSKPKDKLLLIMIDGFRWDFPNCLPVWGGFKKIIRNGVQAKHMEPIYPSDSYPNYFALTTGLYAENHGIVANYMYDPDEDIMFEMGQGDQSWYSKIEPVWVTAVLNNISTANLRWPLGDKLIKGIRAKYATKSETFNISPTGFKKNLREAVDLLASKGIEFCQVYTAWADSMGHLLTPDPVKNILDPLFIDGIMYDFYDYVKQKKLVEKLNIVIISDHGMTSNAFLSVKDIKIEKIIDMQDVRMLTDFGSHMGIYLKSRKKEDEIYNKLKCVKGIKVYRKDEIPESYHLKNNIRVPPIYIEAEKGYFLPQVFDYKQLGRVNIPGARPQGVHGYNPANFSDMWGTFIATGPAFEKGIEVPAIKNVDVYNLLCHLLGIQPLPNNGTWNHVNHMLVTSQ